MKKLICLLMATLLAVSAVACGTYNGPLDEVGGEVNTSADTTPVTEAETSDEDYSVQLRLEGESFSPGELEIFAQWTDGFSFHTARVDETGKAAVGGLDGDYRVSLSNIPAGLSYNPNAYTADNDNRHIVIDLYRLDKVGRGGDDLYKCIRLTKTGMYQVEITSPNHVVYFELAPTSNGLYNVESWMDVIANNVNPKIDVYSGTVAAKYFAYTLDDGGVSSHYTKNFKYEFKISDEGISTGGQQVFTFGIKCDAKEASAYPIKVNFVVEKNGTNPGGRDQSTLMVPANPDIYTDEQYAYLAAHPPKGKFVGMEVKKDGYMAFDGDYYGYNEETGFYHRINEETGKFDGPVIYAAIGEACRFIDVPFTNIEDPGNKALTVSLGKENYKLFIEGFDSMVRKNYFCVATCPCRTSGVNGGACKVSAKCQNCHPECNACPDEAYGHKGYADVYSLCPVTQELKDFLQKLSVAQRYVFDGMGIVDGNDDVKVSSNDADQWMFACGYYSEQE